MFFSAAALVGLPGMPSSEFGVRRRADREGWPWRARAGRGGGREYALTGLPQDTQAALLMRTASAAQTGVARAAQVSAQDWTALERRYERATETQKAEAARKQAACLQVARLLELGISTSERRAALMVAQNLGVPRSSLQRWMSRVRGTPRERWLALLLDHYGAGGARECECDERAWDLFKSLYLARGAPTAAICYERVARAAREQGWAWPSRRTVERKLKRTVPRAAIVLAREGAEALDRLYPCVERRRDHWQALDAINGDGLLFGPQVRWPDGEVAQVKVWIWQDLGTGKILARRPDKSENRHMVRLAYGDVVERYGIPRVAYIDNTTAAAAKWLTGGAPNRYRWKIRDEDPIGLMPQMGTDVRFVLPAHGQSKPIERAFRELRERVDCHPQFDGRGTAARPIAYAEFMAILDAEIAHFNARGDRTSHVASGTSYDEAFARSYTSARVLKATAEQRRLWLLCAERVWADSETGAITLGRGPDGANRYWCEALGAYAGSHIVVRFDPHALHEAVHCYTLDGRYIGEAPCTLRAGFDDAAAAQTYHREKNRFKRMARRALEAEKRMRTAAAARRLPTAPTTPGTPDSRVVELLPLHRAQPVTADALDGTRQDRLQQRIAAGLVQLRADAIAFDVPAERAG